MYEITIAFISLLRLLGTVLTAFDASQVPLTLFLESDLCKVFMSEDSSW